jgi:hypothetical protein
MNNFQLLAIVLFGIGIFAVASPKRALQLRERLFSPWARSCSVLDPVFKSRYGAIAMRVLGSINIFISVTIFVFGSAKP